MEMRVAETRTSFNVEEKAMLCPHSPDVDVDAAVQR